MSLIKVNQTVAALNHVSDSIVALSKTLMQQQEYNVLVVNPDRVTVALNGVANSLNEVNLTLMRFNSIAKEATDKLATQRQICK